MHSSLSTCKSTFVPVLPLEGASNKYEVFFSLAQRSSLSAYVPLSSNIQGTGELCRYWKNSTTKNAAMMSAISSRAANVNAGVAARFHHRDAGGIEEQGVEQDR